jgi:NAD(P)-dependent dehydrogenase (short-subunit alcohol dehydrogenase family)
VRFVPVRLCVRAQSGHGDISFQAFDASSRSSTRLLIANTIGVYGGLDVLVNNVGVQADNGIPLHELSDDVWDRVLAVNLGSYAVASQAAIKHYLSRPRGSAADGGLRGCIVNMASVQGMLSQRGVPAYAASKGAVLSLTRQLAVEYGLHGVRVNAVSPGTIDTPLVRRNIEQRGLDVARAGDPYPIGKRVRGRSSNALTR